MYVFASGYGVSAQMELKWHGNLKSFYSRTNKYFRKNHILYFLLQFLLGLISN